MLSAFYVGLGDHVSSPGPPRLYELVIWIMIRARVCARLSGSLVTAAGTCYAPFAHAYLQISTLCHYRRRYACHTMGRVGRPRDPGNLGLYEVLLPYEKAEGINTAAAIDSLEKYPRPINSLDDARKLIGVDDFVLALWANAFDAQPERAAPAKTSGTSRPTNVSGGLLDISISDEDDDDVDLRPLAQRLADHVAKAASVGAGASSTNRGSAARAQIGVPRSAASSTLEKGDSQHASASSAGYVALRPAQTAAPMGYPPVESLSSSDDSVIFLEDDVAASTTRLKATLAPSFKAPSSGASKGQAPALRAAAAQSPAASAAAAPSSSSVTVASASPAVGTATLRPAKRKAGAAARTLEEGDVSRTAALWACPCCDRGFQWALEGTGADRDDDDSDDEGSDGGSSARDDAGSGVARRGAWRCTAAGRRSAPGLAPPPSCGASESGAASSSAAPPQPPSHICSLDRSCWEVVLLIDDREVRNKINPTELQGRLQTRGVVCEVRRLELGDMLWIARRRAGAPRPPPVPPVPSASDTALAAANKDPSSPGDAKGKGPKAGKKRKAPPAGETDGDEEEASSSAKPAKAKPKRASAVAPLPPWEAVSADPEAGEWVLDFIVERKKVDDLAASVIDGRYEEQKARLASTGLRRVVYLVEGDPRSLAGTSSRGGGAGGGDDDVGGSQALGGSGGGGWRGGFGGGGGRGRGRGGRGGGGGHPGFEPGKGAAVVKRVLSALHSTAVHSGYQVARTRDFSDSVEYLVKLHHAVAALFAKACSCQLQGGSSASGGSFARGLRGVAGRANTSAAAAAVDAAFDSYAALAQHIQGFGSDGQVMLSQAAMAMSQAIEDTTAAAGNALWLIGGGASSAGGSAYSDGTPSPVSAAGNVGPPHLCRYDRCNLWGRPGLPRVVRSYREFKALSAKARAYTVRQLFGRMLRQINGLSENRALAVLERFPVPTALAAAFDAQPTTRAKMEMLASLPVRGQINGTLGPALSAAVYTAFNNRDAAPLPRAAGGQDAATGGSCSSSAGSAGAVAGAAGRGFSQEWDDEF